MHQKYHVLEGHHILQSTNFNKKNVEKPESYKEISWSRAFRPNFPKSVTTPQVQTYRHSPDRRFRASVTRPSLMTMWLYTAHVIALGCQSISQSPYTFGLRTRRYEKWALLHCKFPLTNFVGFPSLSLEVSDTRHSCCSPTPVT
jgi:hypothetical protein